MPLRDPVLGGWSGGFSSEVLSRPENLGKWERERKAGCSLEDASALGPVNLSSGTKASFPEASRPHAGQRLSL